MVEGEGGVGGRGGGGGEYRIVRELIVDINLRGSLGCAVGWVDLALFFELYADAGCLRYP